MWLLLLIISIKLQMPTWYWIIFTILTLMKPILLIIEKSLEKEIDKTIKEIVKDK